MANLDGLSPHSDSTLIAESQKQKAATSNAVDNLVANATQKRLSVTISDAAGSPTVADKTLTSDEFYGNHFFHLSGTPSVDFDLTIPGSGYHLFAVFNETGRTCTVTLGSGATVDLPDDAIYVLHFDGTDVRQITGGPGTIYDFGATFETAPDAGAIFGRVLIGRDILIPPDFSGSFGAVDTNPGASYDIDVQDDGASIGTITVSTGGSFTFSTTSGTLKQIASGSVITFVASSGSPTETTIAGLSIIIRATVR